MKEVSPKDGESMIDFIMNLYNFLSEQNFPFFLVVINKPTKIKSKSVQLQKEDK